MSETGRDISDFTTLDSFLDEEGIREDVSIAATKRVVAMQLEMAMRDQQWHQKWAPAAHSLIACSIRQRLMSRSKRSHVRPTSLAIASILT